MASSFRENCEHIKSCFFSCALTNTSKKFVNNSGSAHIKSWGALLLTSVDFGSYPQEKIGKYGTYCLAVHEIPEVSHCSDIGGTEADSVFISFNTLIINLSVQDFMPTMTIQVVIG